MNDENDEIEHNVINNTRKYDIKLANKITKILSKERATNRCDWLNVGICLHNISRSKLLLKSWIEFSKKWDGYLNDTECIRKWKEFRNYENNLSIGSLKYWAEEDNPEVFKKIKKEAISDIMYKTCAGKKDQPTGAHYGSKHLQTHCPLPHNSERSRFHDAEKYYLHRHSGYQNEFPVNPWT